MGESGRNGGDWAISRDRGHIHGSGQQTQQYKTIYSSQRTLDGRVLPAVEGGGHADRGGRRVGDGLLGRVHQGSMDNVIHRHRL